MATFEGVINRFPGWIDLALAPVKSGEVVCLGGDTPAHAWSTMKVPVLVALLRARGENGLTPAERDLATRAITASDNQSILELFNELEQVEGGRRGAEAAIQDVLGLCGDRTPFVATALPPLGAATTFGQTEWSASASVRFIGALARGELLPQHQTQYVVSLMERIEPAESWGLGSAGFSAPVAFKGGWGPEPSGGYTVRQTGIVDPASRRPMAVSIVAYAPPGDQAFASGVEMVNAAARWLADGVVLSPST